MKSPLFFSMPATNDNLEIPANTWTDVNALSASPASYILDIQNVGYPEIQYAFSDTRPQNATPNAAYRILKRGEILNVNNSLTLWMYCQSASSFINVSAEAKQGGGEESSTGAYGAVLAESLTPIAQISAQYGILNDVQSVNADVSGIGQTAISLITIRNRTHFGNGLNFVEIYPLLLSAAAQSTKPMFFELLIDPVFADEIVFDFFDEQTSATEVSYDNVDVSGGRSLGAITVTSDKDLVFNEGAGELFIEAGETLTIAARVSSGAAGDAQVSFNWEEDY